MNKSYSAGGLVVNDIGQVLVVSQGGNSWSLPKGHIEPNEDARRAAEREIKEESGISDLTYVKELGSYERYKIAMNGIGEDKGELKHITMLLFTTKQFDLRPEDPHNPEARWVAPNEVSALLTHPKDKEFFESILPEVESIIAQ